MRKRMVTRTIKTTQFKCLVADKNANLSSVYVAVTGEIKSEQYDNICAKLINSDTMRFVMVQEATEKTALYAVDEAEFLQIAHEVVNTDEEEENE